MATDAPVVVPDDGTPTTAELIGNSPTASDALSSLGGDLTLSISWAVANELLDAAKEAQIGEGELVAIVLTVSIVLQALPNALWLARTEVAAAWEVTMGRRPSVRPDPTAADKSGLLAFLALFVKVGQRITMSVAVQLIASNVHVTQPIRAVRVLTLAGVAVFFVFLESTATVGRVRGRGRG